MGLIRNRQSGLKTVILQSPSSNMFVVTIPMKLVHRLKITKGCIIEWENSYTELRIKKVIYPYIPENSGNIIRINWGN